MSSIPILSPEQSAEWDSRAADRGIALATLMESAGRAAVAAMLERLARHGRQGVLVVAGPGNNGGDGWVMARALRRAGWPVWVAPLEGTLSDLNDHVRRLALDEGVPLLEPDGPWPGVGLVVDAILGTGARGAPRQPAAAALARMQELGVPLVAIDGPTGVDLMTGAAYGHPRADLTITFGGLRRGHLLARDEVGEVVVVDIGHPLWDGSWPQLVLDHTAARWLPSFGARSHKGTRGRVVVVGGNPGMGGALRLSCRAAFGAGAGLVHAAAPAATIQALVEAEPDVQTVVQEFDAPAGDSLLELVAGAPALVIGPGLGRAAGDGRLDLIRQLLAAAQKVIIDADGLNALGALERWSDIGPELDPANVVLTPHPGEFRRLFPDLAGHLETNPWDAAQAAADRSGVTVLLKGQPTVVASVGHPAWTIAAGNPGLATGGSGDVLSGIVGALLAQGLEPRKAGALAAHALARSADIVVRRTTARGLRPMDVVNGLAEVWRTLARTSPECRAPVLLTLPRPDST